MSPPARLIYLDHHATTPVDARVLEAMLPFFREKFGNAASVGHSYGREAAEAVERSREQVASLLGTDSRSLVFTSGGTESNNLAIKGVLLAGSPGGHAVTTAVEHRSVLDPLRRFARRGYSLTVVPVDSHGLADPGEIARAIRPETRLVSVIFANNEVGSIHPLREIGEICRARGVLFHTDAVQAVGKIPVDLETLGVDLLSASAHKIYGPQGVGALYVRREGERIALEPLLHGGGHEKRLRSGTLPVPLIVGFGAACEIAQHERASESQRLAKLRDRLWDGLCHELSGLLLNGHPTERLPGNLNVSFEGVEGDALLARLGRLAVSSGSACTSADPEPSHVLLAIGRSLPLVEASLRFGLGRETTPEEIDEAVQIVSAAVRGLRQGTGASLS